MLESELERILPNKDYPSFKAKSPFKARVISNTSLVSKDCEDDIRHIVFSLKESGFKHVNGQSIGVIPLGEDEKGRPHKQRIYSIASSALGDDGEQKTLSLCVKRANTLGEDGVLYKGVCSNYICDLKPDDEVYCTGALGRALMLPKDENTKLILLATGTGIAPMRAFINHIYNDIGSYKGGIDFYFGAKRADEALYMNDVNAEISNHKNDNINMKTYLAFSREMQTKDGKKMYIQNKVGENIEKLWEDIESGNFSLYICGLKGIEEGLDEIISAYASNKGKDWESMKKEFKKQKRWNVEVY